MLLRYAPGHMRNLVSGSRLKYDNLFEINKIEEIDVIENGLSSAIGLDYAKHKEALWKLQAKIYEEQPYVFLFSSKSKIAISKRFDNRNMYTERPGVILNNLKVNNKNLVPTTGE